MSLAGGAMLVRPARFPDDLEQVLAIDRSFSTDRIYRIVRTPATFRLEEVMVVPPLVKQFPLEDDVSERRAHVAEVDRRIVGFAAYAHQEWNRRTELWHLYVATTSRGSGVGRALIQAVVASARNAGARCVWLETSNVAWPAIQLYRRMGFTLCGLDASLYDPDETAGGETALFFSLPLLDHDADADGS